MLLYLFTTFFVIPAKAGIHRPHKICYEFQMSGVVYILASKKYGTLYIGITSDLPRRIFEHKNKLIPGFTSRYNVTRLVYVEHFFDIRDAIAREKSVKAWKRAWKIELIESVNPDWSELTDLAP
jgi:putative endonuclease